MTSNKRKQMIRIQANIHKMKVDIMEADTEADTEDNTEEAAVEVVLEVVKVKTIQ